MKASTKAIRFLEILTIPEGPLAGQRLKLAPFQKQFVKGALADGINVAVLRIGRGNAKTALCAPVCRQVVCARLLVAHASSRIRRHFSARFMAYV